MPRFATVLRQALRPRNLALPAVAAAVLATLPLADAGRPTPAQTEPAAWTPMTPASVRYGVPADGGPGARLGLLGFNDFHGNIDPPTGSGGQVNGVPAGGVEYLATTVKRLRQESGSSSDKVLTVAAGDNIGASPLVSAAFHDEPTIELFNSMGVDMSSVGNHEFDEGVRELQRIQVGNRLGGTGCHPTDGCLDGDPYGGARFPYLAANVVDKRTRLPILLPFTVKVVNGVKVGFIGMTLKGTPSIVNPAGISTVDFLDEAETANAYASKLRRYLGIKAFVLLIHQGGLQSPPPTPLDPSGCANFAGDITPIVAKLDPAFGVVVSGHTHRFYTCSLPNTAGQSLVTSAGSFGVLVTDIDAQLSRSTGQFVAASAHNVVVENGVLNPDGTYARNPDGSFVRDPSKVDPDAKRIADKYRAAVAPIAGRVVGSVTATIVRAANAAGESPLGDVIADAQLAYTASAGAQLALMNPGGIRADLPGPGERHVRRRVHRAAVQQPGGDPDLHRGAAEPGAGAAVRRLRWADHHPDPADLRGPDLLLRLHGGVRVQGQLARAGRHVDRPRGHLPGDHERLPGQRRGRVHAADRRDRPGHRAGLRRGRADRLPRRELAGAARPGEPDHQDRVSVGSRWASGTAGPAHRDPTVTGRPFPP